MLPVRRNATAARVDDESGKPFNAWTQEDYTSFMSDLDLDRDSDLSKWSRVTDIPVVALREGCHFFRYNAHLFADAAAARGMSVTELERLESMYDRGRGLLRVLGADGEPVALRNIEPDVIRELPLAGQIRHDRDLADETISLEALGPHLVPPADLTYRKEVAEGIRLLPLSIVKVLGGKALYLSMRSGEGCDTLSHYISSDQNPGYAGMQPGLFLEGRPDGTTVNEMVRGLGRLILDTVLEGSYFGIYAYSRQFPEFQKLNPQRRRIFGRRRDKLPQTSYGYIGSEAPKNATDNFAQHFVAYLTKRDAFRGQALTEQRQGHPELMEKFEFMRQLVEHTPATVERLSPEHLSRSDSALQRDILEEYLTRRTERSQVIAQVHRKFGKSFSEFDETDYSRFMADLDLSRDDDLWRWSHVTDIPIVALNQRSNFFHMNAHLLEDVELAKLLPWSELTAIVSTYDGESDELQLVGGDGQPLRIRNLPAGVVQRTDTKGHVSHNEGFVEDRIVHEALEPYLLRLADLENREELNEGIRLLPLSIVKAHRGKALYPTNRSKTGWAVTWRISNDRNVSYVGLQPGSFIEPRRDEMRAPIPAEALVANSLSSLRGNSTDSLLHEVGHIIDSPVIGGRSDRSSFPHQFPEFQRLLTRKNLIFGEGAARVDQTTYGYISSYATTNAQESFAEHFWAYLRDREAFLQRALREDSEGHPELLDKFRFMEELIDQTPPTIERLSSEYLAKSSARQHRERAARQDDVLRDYLAQRARREAVVAATALEFGKPFDEFSNDDYASLLESLDLNRDEDLWKWSHVTGIPVVGLSQKSVFFYCNAHLLENVQAAVEMPYAEIVKLERGYDPESDKPTLHSADGHALKLRDVPAGTIRRTDRTGRFSHDEDYAEPRIVLEVLAPYLVPLEEVPNRRSITRALQALPLSIVKAYRGKAIYLTTRPGRSYSTGMPVSNSVYKGFAGMQTGAFIDHNAEELTTHNLVHELGHVIDYTVIVGQYGTYVHPYQYPAWRELREYKDRVFGEGDSTVPQTKHGYVSSYAKRNAQENFAEHFAFYILERETFRTQAVQERSTGHPELMEKYRFLETLVDRTPVTTYRLSRSYLENLDGAPRDGG